MNIIHWNQEAPVSGIDILYHLKKEGGICLRDFPVKDNAALLKLGHHMRPRANFQQQFLEDDYIYRVQFDGEGSQGVISQTRLKFPLHTDAFRAPQIPAYMLLLVVKQADQGGESQFLHIDEITNDLPQAVLQTLEKDTYIFPSGVSRTILTKTASGYEIAYNPYDIAGIPVSERNVDAQEAFAEKMSRHVFDFYRTLESSPLKTSVRLQAGDCIVLDNKKVLHARSAYSGSRLLKRMWVHQQPLHHEAIG